MRHDDHTLSTSLLRRTQDAPGPKSVRTLMATRRPLLQMFLVLVLIASACGGQASVTGTAEFDVEPLTESTPQPAADPGQDEAIPGDTDDQTPDPEPSADPVLGEPEVGDDPAADASAPAEEPTDADEPEPSDTPTPVDSSRRGQVIPVTDPSGSLLDRVQTELGAGEELQYSFTVDAGQSVLIRQLGDCEFSDGTVLLADLDGPRGVNGGVFFSSSNQGCTESNRYDATAAGLATLTFADSDPAFTGSFSFEVIDVTNEPTVVLALGDIVSSNAPIEGAGVLEFPGSVDVYQFDVVEGGAYLVRQLGCELVDTSAARFDFEGAGSGTSFLHPESCDSVDRFEARESGTVVMYASAGASHKGTGTYSFELVDLRATDAFELEFGDVVSPGVPGVGAGVIEDPGRRDLYSLDVTADQTVAISQQGECDFEGGSGLAMNVQGAGINTNLFFNDGECFDVQRFTAKSNGTVTMLVREANNTVTGSYTFKVGAGSETIEEAEEVLDELDATLVDEERLITLDETVLFDFGSAELKPNANQALAEVADVLGVYADGQVRVVGHTDAVGSDADNDRLSQQRADAVSLALVGLGVDPLRVTASGLGETSPVEPNENDDGSDNPEGRAANRRVEIFFTANE